MDFYDLHPQKFYLLSSKSRRLFTYESTDRSLENAVENAFEKLPKIKGGNIYAVFRYEKTMLDVMTELSEKLKEEHPSIQQLPAYFRRLEEGDVFIRHQAWAPLCDLKRSIIKSKAIIDKRNINKDDTIFVLNWARLYLKYETYSYGFLTDKIYIGESNPSKRVCRFCNKTGANRFKNESHAVMEALGNKLLFCYEECDECNQEFEGTVEKHLYKFLEINRTLANISGKGSRNHHLEGLNFHIHPDPKTLLPIVFVKQEHIINDQYKGKLTGKILLYNKGEISYYGIYKALVKIALDMIPSSQVVHFKKTGNWVHGDIYDKNLPMFLYGEHRDFFEQPVIDLFFKNERSPAFSPYCTIVLYIFNSVFIYTMPFCDKDGDNFGYEEPLKTHWDFFKKCQYLYVDEWEEFDANNKTMLTPFYKIPIFSNEMKYRLEFRPSADEVFHIKRK